MKSEVNLIFLCYLWILSVYHVFTGIISFFFPEQALSFYKKFYDCNPVERKHLVIVLKPWGALAVFAGIAGIFAALDPGKCKGTVAGLAILLAMRIYYRIAFRDMLRDISGISPHRNLMNICLLLVGIIIIASWFVSGGLPW